MDDWGQTLGWATIGGLIAFFFWLRKLRSDLAKNPQSVWKHRKFRGLKERGFEIYEGAGAQFTPGQKGGIRFFQEIRVAGERIEVTVPGDTLCEKGARIHFTKNGEPVAEARVTKYWARTFHYKVYWRRKVILVPSSGSIDRGITEIGRVVWVGPEIRFVLFHASVPEELRSIVFALVWTTELADDV